MFGERGLRRLDMLKIRRAGHIDDLFMEYRSLMAVVAEKRRSPCKIKRHDCLCVGHHAAQRLERVEDAVRALQDVRVVRARNRWIERKTPVSHCRVSGERHRHHHRR